MKERLHTADNILCTITQRYGAKTRAMEFENDYARITFESPIDIRHLKEEIEKEVNEVIKKDFEVVNYILPRAEAEKLADISMVPETINEVSIYEIVDFNKITCGGPHLKRISEVGRFEIIIIIIIIKKKGANIYSVYYTVK